MRKPYDLLVFIGRFQPFHLGHQAVVEEALEKAKQVLVLVGSANQPRDTRNPFTFWERKDMIEDSILEHLGEAAWERLSVTSIQDMYNDQLWIKQVQQMTSLVLETLPGNSPNNTLHGMNEFKIGLIGHSKDNSSYYLKMFPAWESVEVENYIGLNATDIRKQFFDPKITDAPLGVLLSDTVSGMLACFRDTEVYDHLHTEHTVIEQYKQSWAGSPYPPMFITTDAVVIQSGHVLMVERGAAPGKGQMALPGGFLNAEELIVHGMIRELREETKLKVPEPVLRGSIVTNQVFDAVNRSTRGRTVTHAFLLKLEDRAELPKVKGSDDAKKAFWVPLGDLDPSVIFEDHYHIIQTMVSHLA